MKAILLDRLPRGYSQQNSRMEARGGIARYDNDFLSNLLRWGTFDNYFVCREHALLPGPSQLHPRLEAIGLEDGNRINASHTCILYRSGTDLSPFVPYRHIIGRPELPICGVTHGLSDKEDIPRYIMQCHLDLRPYDAVVCTSPCALATLRNLFTSLSESPLLCGNIHIPQIHYPLIPIGVSCCETCPPRSRVLARQLLGISPDTFVLITLGRLSPINKAELRPVIMRFAAFAFGVRPLKWIIAGDDSDYNLCSELERFIEHEGASKYVSVMPNIDDETKHLLLASSDLSLALSDTLTETYGISVAEALWHGIPVLATDWNGYRYLVREGENGYLIPTSLIGDEWGLSGLGSLFDNRAILGMAASFDCDYLFERLSLLMNHPTLLLQMSESARTDARQRFDWKGIIGQYESLWLWQEEQARQFRVPEGSVRPSCYVRYDRGFAHHPTRIFSGDSYVMSSTPIYHRVPHGMSWTLDENLSARLHAYARSWVRIRDAVAAFSEERPPVHVALHLMHLIKYRQMMVASGTPPEGDQN